MSQPKQHSWVEAWTNVAIGYAINIVANLLIFPLFGINIAFTTNLGMGLIYTVISVMRSYVLRRLFNRVTERSNTQAGQPQSR
jgi:hypothetical protein